jgi:hypothetical protein
MYMFSTFEYLFYHDISIYPISMCHNFRGDVLLLLWYLVFTVSLGIAGIYFTFVLNVDGPVHGLGIYLFVLFLVLVLIPTIDFTVHKCRQRPPRPLPVQPEPITARPEDSPRNPRGIAERDTCIEDAGIAERDEYIFEMILRINMNNE